MLRCGRCGCRKFIFTTHGDRFGKHHGAICALCRKRLTVRDIRINPVKCTSSRPALSPAEIDEISGPRS